MTAGDHPSGWVAASIIAFIGAAATAVLAVGHAGVAIPLVSALGPGGSRPVWPAAAAFAVAAACYVAVGVGLRARRQWSAFAGSALFGVTILLALVPYRGVGSIVGAALGFVGLTALSLPALRRWNDWTTRRRTGHRTTR